MELYKDNMAAYALGRRANMEEWNAITRTLSGTTALGFGVPAIAGADNHTCAPLTAAGQNVLGITEASQVLPHIDDEFHQYDNVAICEVGVIGVLLGANVTQGAVARYDLTAKAWTGAAASTTVLTIPGAQFDESGTKDSIGIVRYRRPVPSLSVGA